MLDSESLRPADDNSKDDEPSTSSSLPHISLVDITSVVRCLDPSLPVGHAFWVGLVSQPTGLYFVAGIPFRKTLSQQIFELCTMGSNMRRRDAQSAMLNFVSKFCLNRTQLTLDLQSQLMLSMTGTKAEAEGWVDGLLLCAHIASMKQLPALRQALKQPVSDQELDQSRKDTPIDT